MPHESPSNNEPEGSKDGRQWTNAEIFAFVGFLNDERNDGALQNTTTKFVARVRSIIPLVVKEPYEGEDLGTGPLTTIFGAVGLTSLGDS
ncbi:hypothetical protein E4U47_005955 [Claviceps purpurea]|nr:hypothetical protein E4U47_005955 [Claviceps purpurea]